VYEFDVRVFALPIGRSLCTLGSVASLQTLDRLDVRHVARHRQKEMGLDTLTRKRKEESVSEIQSQMLDEALAIL